GAAPLIHGMGFANYQYGPDAVDIYVPNTNYGITISGCRSETNNFIWAPSATHTIITACSHTPGANATGNDYFFKGDGQGRISNCVSDSGNVQHGYGDLHVVNSDFGGHATDWNQSQSRIAASHHSEPYLSKVSNLDLGTNARYSGGIFDNASASGEVDFTLPS